MHAFLLYALISAALLLLGLTSACTPGKNGFGGNNGKKEEALSQDNGGEVGTNPGEEGSGATDPASESEGDDANLSEHDVLAKHPKGPDSLQVVCARPGQDRVREVFCGPNPPNLTGLVDLQRLLGLDFASNPAFVFSAHSTSLVTRFTSAINPRAIIFSRGAEVAGVPNYVAMGFIRGEQFVELIANDPQTNELQFFLIQFEQACNANQNCGYADLLTPAIEENWTGYSLYEDTDLENTIIDCKQCHQPDGPAGRKILRMQELDDPWTHFLLNRRPGGQALIVDYYAAHGMDEAYAGIPGPQVNNSDPELLEDLTRFNGFPDQPNVMQTEEIDAEVIASSPAQPQDNSVPGTSATWQAQYDASVRGEFIPFPYHDVKVSDPQKLAAMTKAYQDYKAGALSKEDFPDIREVFLDAKLPEIGFAVKPGLTGREILIQACTQCHNSKLNQDISRAKFNVDLSTMSREAKDKAIERIMLPASNLQAMPPRRFKTLSEAEKQLVIEELKK